MSGRLANKDFDQLEKWIGTGSKTFTLLFAVTRDGCGAETFHQKCDDIGPTVTVLYNATGSVYGGYNPTSWASGQAHYNYCTDAFLFQLYLNGNPKPNKFVVKKGCYQNAVYNQTVYGPTFGKGHDLSSFTYTVNRSGDTFKLNGTMNLGHTYDMDDIAINEINNGNLIVTELEVYKVTYDEKRVREHWRDKDDWNIQEMEKLKEKVIAFKPFPDLNISEAKIAMIGPVGAGKSSFYNTIDTLFRGRITQRACSGSAEQSITTGYIPYSVTAQSGDSLKFVLCDTPGLEESTGLDEKECSSLLDGNIPNFYQFNQDDELPTKGKGSEKETTTIDRIHCVLFVLDATTLDVLSSKVVEKIKNFQRLMNQREIPQLIVLTKIDKLCKDVKKDISFAYKSWVVEEHIEKASQLLGVRQSSVLRMKNYKDEKELDTDISILTLIALSKILDSVEDYMYNLRDRKKFAHWQMDISEKK